MLQFGTKVELTAEAIENEVRKVIEDDNLDIDGKVSWALYFGSLWLAKGIVEGLWPHDDSEAPEGLLYVKWENDDPEWETYFNTCEGETPFAGWFEDELQVVE